MSASSASEPTAGDWAAGPVTVGVAVAIPEPYAEVLTEWRLKVGDRAARKMWPHITLLPPTSVPDGHMDEVDRHLADAVAGMAPFEVHLAGTGTFRPVSPVVFVQVARGVSECERIEAAVRSGPLERELDFPYHPHVTIAQEIPEPALEEAYEGLADFTARFTVETIELFTRGVDGQWAREREFPLNGQRG